VTQPAKFREGIRGCVITTSGVFLFFLFLQNMQRRGNLLAERPRRRTHVIFHQRANEFLVIKNMLANGKHRVGFSQKRALRLFH